MNRLPSGDRITQHSELAVFAGLGLAGALMVWLAVGQTTQLVRASDRISAVLAGQQASKTITAPTAASKNVVTNMASHAQNRASARLCTPGEVQSSKGTGDTASPRDSTWRPCNASAMAVGRVACRQGSDSRVQMPVSVRRPARPPSWPGNLTGAPAKDTEGFMPVRFPEVRIFHDLVKTPASQTTRAVKYAGQRAIGNADQTAIKDLMRA